MFSEEIINSYILYGSEETNIEYKDSLNWSNRIARQKIICAMLAMANNDGGGVIIIGVKENKVKGSRKKFEAIGMSDADYDSFDGYDDFARKINNYCDPVIEFKFTKDEAQIKKNTKKFIVIQVSESTNPTICVKSEKIDNSKDYFSSNIALRENVIYIRSKAPIESREISSVHEWRELINRAIQKNKKEIFKLLPCKSSTSKKNKTDEEKFNKDRERDHV